VTSTRMTGAQSLTWCLEKLGVNTVFGIPGGAILPAYDSLLASPIRHVLVRHEQGGGHAATGYAQATGEVGVCMATSGPGGTNLVTAIADAHMDSVPVVAITGQVPTGVLGTDAFQETDICGVTRPITKHNVQVTRAEDIPARLTEAFALASGGRQGPVLVDITKDALQGVASFRWPPAVGRSCHPVVASPRAELISKAAELITGARRPVLYVGGGVLKAEATAELKVLAELTGMPVTTTLMALGAFPASHPLHLGMPGMHGTVTAITALQRSDLIVALGARFDDRVTGEVAYFAPHAKIVHADIDPAEIGKNRGADVPIVGDARQVIAELILAITGRRQAGYGCDYAQWRAELSELRHRYPLHYEVSADGLLAPQRVIQRIGELAPVETIYVAGVGQHQMWAAQFIGHDRPRAWLNSGGAGTMGYAVPAAMGAKAGRPGSTVWAIDGDGGFQMTCQELVTCVLNRLPVKVAIINNGTLGMVRQWQTLFYEERYSNTSLHCGPMSRPGDYPRVPDFVLLAEAMGCVGLRCEDAGDLDAVIAKANSIEDCPVVVDFVVDPDAMVWPMVPSGAANDEILVARGVRAELGPPRHRNGE
jgi:acetolactate synthase-1/2/3 large subunit